MRKIGTWPTLRTQFDRLSLREHGDDIERDGAIRHKLDSTLPYYEAFWRYHVAPATQRPHSALLFLPGTDEVVITICQRSYTVFAYLFEAHEYLSQLKAGDVGPRHRHWYNAVTFSGNAMQAFEGFQKAVENDLAGKIGQQLRLFPDWEANWKVPHEQANRIRNHVTHKGMFQIFSKDGRSYVLDPALVPPGRPGYVAWTESIADFQRNPSRYVELHVAAESIINDVLAWLNAAYQRVTTTLLPLLNTTAYEQLWGWEPNAPLFTTTRPVFEAASSPGISGQMVVPFSMCATTTPPPKQGEIYIIE